METLLEELVHLIASNLNSYNLSNFRHVYKKLATTSAYLVACNGISILNTLNSLKELENFIQTEIANSARALIVYYRE
jgi:hypothetical protein